MVLTSSRGNLRLRSPWSLSSRLRPIGLGLPSFFGLELCLDWLETADNSLGLLLVIGLVGLLARGFACTSELSLSLDFFLINLFFLDLTWI